MSGSAVHFQSDARAPTLPPTTEDADQTAEAMQFRRKVLKQMNEKFTPGLRKWIVQALVSDIEKAAG